MRKLLLIPFLGFQGSLALLPAAFAGEVQTTASVHDATKSRSQHPLASPRAVIVDGLAVGDMLDTSKMHIITRPGLYGLAGSSSAKNRYGILDGKLLRFDPRTMQLRAIIRSGVVRLD